MPDDKLKDDESKSASEESKKKLSYTDTILKFLEQQKTWRSIALILCIIGIPLGLLAAWFVWFKVVPAVWMWGFEPLGWSAIPSILALFFLVFLPVYLPVIPAIGIQKILALYISDQEKALEQAHGRIRHAEKLVDSQTENTEQEGLMPLIKYSREQLEAYYLIGLSQTRKSFMNSVIAMWIGFLIIVVGIAQYIIPLEQFGLKSPGTDINIVIIAGGAIVEIISALFLWVYRSSIGQLTYFYNRQMHMHNVLFCFRIASTMKEPDETKKLLVEKVMEKIWNPERPESTSSKGLMNLFNKNT